MIYDVVEIVLIGCGDHANHSSYWAGRGSRITRSRPTEAKSARPYTKTKFRGSQDIARAGECLPSKHKNVGSIPSTNKTKRKITEFGIIRLVLVLTITITYWFCSLSLGYPLVKKSYRK